VFGARLESGVAWADAIGGKPPPTFEMHAPVGGGLPREQQPWLASVWRKA